MKQLAHPKKLISIFVVYVILYNFFWGPSTFTSKALDYGAPWYDVLIDNQTYTVYLDMLSGQLPSTWLDSSVHGSNLQNIYVVDQATGDLATDPGVRDRAALTAQNRAIMANSWLWMEQYAPPANQDTKRWDNIVDDEGVEFDVFLPIVIRDGFIQNDVLPRLKDYDQRVEFYRAIIYSMAFPELNDTNLIALEAEFIKELGSAQMPDTVLYKAIKEAEATVGTIEWGIEVVEGVKNLVHIKHDPMFSLVTSSLLLYLRAADAPLAITQKQLELSLQLALYQAIGHERIEALLQLVASSTVEDPALQEAIVQVANEADAMADPEAWEEVFRELYKEQAMATAEALWEVAFALAELSILHLAAHLIPVVGQIVLVYKVAKLGIKLLSVYFEWLNDQANQIAIAGLAHSIEYTMRQEMKLRFSVASPPIQNVDQWLTFSNMRVFADQYFYAVMLERFDWVLWTLYDLGTYWEDQKALKYQLFVDTLPRTYWSYPQKAFILSKVADANPDTPPILTGPGVGPSNSGDTDTAFTFAVTYTDIDGDAPDTVKMIVTSGNSYNQEFTLSSTDTSYTDGAAFSRTLSGFSAGIYYYYFQAQQGGNAITTNSQNFYVTQSADGHDLTLFAMSLSRDSAEQGDSFNIYAQINNNGIYTENFISAEVSVSGPATLNCTTPINIGSLNPGAIWGGTNSVLTSCAIPSNVPDGEYSVQVTVVPSTGDQNWSDNSRSVPIYISNEPPLVYMTYQYRFHNLTYSANPGIPNWSGDAYGPATTSYGGKTYTVYMVPANSNTTYRLYIRDQNGVEYRTFYNGTFPMEEGRHLDNDKLFVSVDWLATGSVAVMRLGHPVTGASITPAIQSIAMGESGTYQIHLPCSSCSFSSRTVFGGSGGDDPPKVFFDQTYNWNSSQSGQNFTLTAQPSTVGVKSFAFATENTSTSVTNYLIFGKVEGYQPVDNPPSVTIVSPMPDSAIFGSQTVSATAVDDKAVNRVEFYVNNVLKHTDYQSPFVYSPFDTLTVADGTHSLRVTAYDSAGQSISETISFKIDNNAPQIGSPQISPTNPGQVPILVSADITDAVGVASAALRYNDGAGWLTLSMVNTISSTWQAQIPQHDAGTIQYEITAVDALARSTASITRTITVTDQTAPGFMNWSQSPPDITENTVGAVQVQVTLIDTGGSGLAGTPGFDYRIGGAYDGYQPMTNSGGNTWHFDIPAHDWDSFQGQTLYYRVSASDAVNNVGISVERSDYIEPINDMPQITQFTPQDSELAVSPGNCVNFSVSATDDENVPLSYTWFVNTVQQTTGTGFQYCPPDLLAYTIRADVSDGTHVVRKYWVIIGNLPPIVTTDSYSTAFGQQLLVSAQDGVLSNDSDPEGDPMVATLQLAAVNGAVSLNADGSFTYTPATEFVGLDSFTYTVSDGLNTSQAATVYITVESPVNLVLLTPSPETVISESSGYLRYRWTNNEGATKYKLWIGQYVNQNGVTSLQSRAFLDDIQQSLYCSTVVCSIDLHLFVTNSWHTNGSYVVWLHALNDAGPVTAWAGPFGFALDVPQAAAPNSVQVSNPETTTPDIHWSLGNTAEYASWFNVQVINVDRFGQPASSMYSTWYRRGEVCDSMYIAEQTPCQLLSPQALPTANPYAVRVRSWGPNGMSAWSDYTFFNVGGEPAILPADILSEPRQGRPLISWNDDPNTWRVQLWMGPYSGGNHSVWYERDGLNNNEQYPTFFCDGDRCWIEPNVNWANGTYQVWLQAWGPGGYSTGGTDAPSAPSWARGQDLVMNFGSPVAPTSLNVAYADPDIKQFSWQPVTGATWYEIRVQRQQHAFNYSKWVLANNLSAECGDAAAACVFFDQILSDSLEAGEYEFSVRAWGPGGMGPFSPVFVFDGSGPPGPTAAFIEDFEDGDIVVNPTWNFDPARLYSVVDGVLYADGAVLDQSGRYIFMQWIEFSPIAADGYLEISFDASLRSPGNPQTGLGIQAEFYDLASGTSYILAVRRGLNDSWPTNKYSVSLGYSPPNQPADLIITPFTPEYNQVYRIRAVREGGQWTFYVNDVEIGSAADPVNLTSINFIRLTSVGSSTADNIKLIVP